MSDFFDMKKTPELIQKKWELKLKQLKIKTDVSHKQKILDLKERLEKTAHNELQRKIFQAEKKKTAYLKKKELEYKRKCENEIRLLEGKPERTYKAKKLSPNQKLQFALQIAQENAKLRDTNEYGEGRCISCGDQKERSDLAGGHFISRIMKSVCLRPENINAQCHKCNMITGPLGNVQLKAQVQHYYRIKLIEKYGEDRILELEEERDREVINPQKHHPTENFLNEYIPDLIKENKELWKTKKFQPPQRKNWEKLYKKYFTS